MLFLKGEVKGLPDVENSVADVETLNVRADAGRVKRVLTALHVYPEGSQFDMSRLGMVTLDGAGSASVSNASFDGTLMTALGKADVDAEYKVSDKLGNVVGILDVADLDLGTLLGNNDLGLLTAGVFGKVALNGKTLRSGTVSVDVTSFGYKGYTYNDITGSVDSDGKALQCEAKINDENVSLDVTGDLNLSKEFKSIAMTAHLDNFNPNKLNLTNKYEGYTMVLMHR
jgi:hypothetical protein